MFRNIFAKLRFFYSNESASLIKENLKKLQRLHYNKSLEKALKVSNILQRMTLLCNTYALNPNQ